MIPSADPVIALQPLPADEEAREPAHEGQPAKDAPREGLALGPDVDGQGEEPARDEGPEAAAQGRERLGDAVEGA